MCSLRIPPHVIDIITIIHKNVDFTKAEEGAVNHQMENNIILRLISYDFLKDVKLLSRREKDLWDVARLDELKNKK